MACAAPLVVYGRPLYARHRTLSQPARTGGPHARVANARRAPLVNAADGAVTRAVPGVPRAERDRTGRFILETRRVAAAKAPARMPGSSPARFLEDLARRLPGFSCLGATPNMPRSGPFGQTERLRVSFFLVCLSLLPPPHEEG